MNIEILYKINPASDKGEFFASNGTFGAYGDSPQNAIRRLMFDFGDNLHFDYKIILD